MTIADIENETSLVMGIVIQGAFEELGVPKEDSLVSKLKQDIEEILTHNESLLKRFKSKRGNYIATKWVIHWLEGLLYREQYSVKRG